VTAPRLRFHLPALQSPLRGRVSDLLGNPFAELVEPNSHEERFLAYALREHRRGRAIAEILDDPYLRTRLTDGERARLVDNPLLARAVATDTSARRPHADM
jgi:hypothetical protein